MSTHNIPFLNIKKENHLKSSQICNYWICSKQSKNEFETALVNEPSMFEPLKFYCMWIQYFKAKMRELKQKQNKTNKKIQKKKKQQQKNCMFYIPKV